MPALREYAPPCGWRGCSARAVGLTAYCAPHGEEARRNVLRALGTHARQSLMWRASDAAWFDVPDGAPLPPR